MARVSQDHLDARRRQILQAARACFVRSGFHRTSMQDIFAESGLSAGAVYNYFPTKDSIVAAIIRQALAGASGGLNELVNRERSPAVAEVIEVVLFSAGGPDAMRMSSAIMVQVWSEALRSPVVERQLLDGMAEILTILTTVVERRRAVAPATGGGVPAGDVARVIAAMVHGFILQRAHLADADLEAFRSAIRALLD